MGESQRMGFVPFSISFFLLTVPGSGLMLNQQDKMCFKKKKLQNEAFSGPSEICVFQLPPALPPLRRSSHPVIHSFCVLCSDAPTHPPDLETSTAMRAGGGRGAPEKLLANQGSWLHAQGF